MTNRVSLGVKLAAAVGLLLVSVLPAGAQVGADRARTQEAADPSIRVIDRTERSITYEVRASWSGRLVEQATADLDRTILDAAGGMPWLSEPIALPAPVDPLVTVLSADFDEVPLPFDPEGARELGMAGPPAAVERVGIERRRPTGTFVARLLHVDPEGGTLRRYHRMTVLVEFAGTAVLYQAPDPQNPHLDVTESVLATGTWFKVPVVREGVHRIDRAFLSALGLNPNTIDPRQVKVFGNSGAPLPALNSAPRIPDLAENPVYVVGGGSGSFGASDAVYFFARASSGWTWDASASPAAWRHYINPFSEANYYFIRVDGPAARQISTAPEPGGAPQVLSQVVGRLFIEEDLPNGMVDRESGGSGLDWLGRDLTRTRNRITVLDSLPPGLAQGTAQFRGRVALQSDVAGQFSFMRGESILAGTTLGRITTNLSVFTHGTVGWTEPVAANLPLRVDLRMTVGSGNPTGWIDYITALYPQNLVATSDYLRFATPGGQSGVFEFALSGFSGAPEVWDVTEVGHTRRLPVAASGNTYRVLMRVEDPNAPREIVAFLPGSSRVRLLDAEAAHAVPNQNLHGLPLHPDYVVVAPAAFMPAAQELAEYRAQGGLVPAVVDIAQIYNEFSGGQVDPRGLRDFLRFIYDRAPGAEPTLRYVLLMGDGNYDYRGIRPGGRENNLIPTFQTDESANYQRSYTSDDYFGLLEPHEGAWEWNVTHHERLDIGIGRLTVRTAGEAADMVRKIKRYEDPANHGAWRLRYTVLADDHLPNDWDRDSHVQNSEAVSQSIRARSPSMNINKVYMGSYPLQQTPLGARYPGATADAIRSLEEGTLVWNYSGHGGPAALADERLITREQIRSLFHPERLAVVITATCTFGRYDLREERSGGEEFVLNPDGGAAAIFTTSRVVFYSSSITSGPLGLNVTVNRYLFTRDEHGRARRLGDVYRLTKAHDIGAQLHNRKFNLLGDPAMRFALPERPVTITEINGIPIGEHAPGLQQPVALEQERVAARDRADSQVAERAPASATDRQALEPPSISWTGVAELRALELATIRGEVLGFDGQPDPSFSGEVDVLVYDVERTHTLAPDTDPFYTDGTFRQRSDQMYRGRASVSGGEWQVEFIVPQDISYAGASARISAYASGGGLDGKGYTEDVIVGTESGPPLADQQGPNIRLFLNDTTFVSGGLVGNEPLLIARLSDESGINMAGVGVGHEMLLVINGNEAEAINVGAFYQSDLDTFRSGTLRYRMPELSTGPNTLSLTAWDVVNNSSTATLDFVVEDSDRLRLAHAYPYPNPTTGPTRFVFEHNQAPGTPAAVQIRIFTISGRPVRTLDGVETLPDGVLPGSPVQIAWDGRDEDFDELATGIYLYRVRVEVDAGDGERRVAEQVERLAIIR